MLINVLSTYAYKLLTQGLGLGPGLVYEVCTTNEDDKSTSMVFINILLFKVCVRSLYKKVDWHSTKLMSTCKVNALK